MAITSRAMTAGELTKARTNGQWSKLLLHVHKPRTIYTAQLAAVPTSNDNVSEVEYNTGSGTLANVKAGMQMWVGTSAGDDDLGVVRIRKAPDANTFFFGMTSKIAWDTVGTIYLTVVDIFPLTFKPMDWTGTWSMDLDTTYTDQHTNFDPVPLMGSHAVICLDTTSTLTFPDISNSWVIGSTISAYSFSSDAGTWTNPTTAGAILNIASYPTNGVINVYCQLTAANGKTFTAHRYVFVWNAANPAITSFALKSNPRCDTSSNGWGFDVTLYDETALTEIREGALVVLSALDYYGGASPAPMGQESGRENVVTWGWIVGESIVWDYESGSVDFSVVGPAQWLKQTPIYIFDSIFRTTATTWRHFPALTPRKALFDLLHWHSTATALFDVWIEDDDRTAPSLQAAKGNVWGQVVELGKGIFHNPGCDRYGRLCLEIDPQMVPEADRTWATVMTVGAGDRLNSINLRKATTPPISLQPMSGFDTNTSGVATTRYSLAVGHIPLDNGSMEAPVDKTLVDDQTQANELCGLYLGWKINPWPEIPLAIPQNNRFYDCWPRQYYSLTLSSSETPREEGFSGNLVPRAVELAWDATISAFSVNVTCEAESFPTLAVDGDAPAGSGTAGGGTTPPPPPPPPPPIDPGDTDLDGPAVVVLATDQGVIYSTNFNTDSPNWTLMTDGMDPDHLNEIHDLVATPNGALFCRANNSAARSGLSSHLYSASGVGATWSVLATEDDFGVGTPYIAAIGADHVASERIAAFGGIDGDGRFALGSSAGLSIVTSSMNMTNFPGNITFDGTLWAITHTSGGSDGAKFTVMTSAGAVSLANQVSGGANANTQFHVNLYNGYILHWDGQANTTYLISKLDGTSNVSYSKTDGLNSIGHAASSPSGVRAILGSITVVSQKSSNSGATLSPLVGIPVGYSIWASSDEDWWIGGTTQSVWATPDFGSTWVTKTGDLATVAPLCVISKIVVIG